MIEKLIKELKEKDTATDILISQGEPPKIRIDGRVISTPEGPLDQEKINNLIKTILGNPSTPLERKSYDKSLEIDGIRLRANIYRQQGTWAIALRRLANEIPQFDSLGFREPWIKEKMFGAGYGLVLVTGPTGSGKTTTLASAIQYLNNKKYFNIITIEDPIEYVFKCAKSHITQREVGLDTDSFDDGLRDAIRANPDVIMVGEMRDPATAETALRAGETGHLVLSTLHSSSIVDSVERIINMFQDERVAYIRTQLSFCLKGIISQRLIYGVEGRRKLVYEALLGTKPVKNLIREGKVNQLVTEISQQGMRTIGEHARELTARGEIGNEDISGITDNF